MGHLFYWMLACQSTTDTSKLQDGETVEVPMGTGYFVEPATPTITTFALLSEIQTGDLVISEVMHTPQATVFDSYGEWIELYNAGNVAIDLQGLELSSSNDGGLTFGNSFVVESGEYVLLATRSSQNGGLDYDGLYSSASIRHGVNDNLSIGYNSVTFDTVAWNRDLTSITDGRSFSLDGDDLDASLNDSDYRWYAGQSTYGDGDYGTPGGANIPLYMGDELLSGDLVITEIMHNPEQVFDSRGEWFEVQNTTDGIVQLYGLSVASTDDIGFTVDGNAWLPVGGIGVFAARLGYSVNGGVTANQAYSYSDFVLGQSDNITLSSNNGTVDAVTYNKFDWGYFTGVSMSLSPVATDADDNDTARFWCEGTSVYGSGDYGTPGTVNSNCANLDYDGDGATIENGDCDDTQSSVNPDVTEVCDGLDNDCDGLTDDEDDTIEYDGNNIWYIDNDGDGYGISSTWDLYGCQQPFGDHPYVTNPYVNNADDCDDLNPLIFPSNDRDGDGIDACVDCDDSDSTLTITINEDPECDGFYLHGNGVTVRCPDAAVNSSGYVNNVEYVKIDQDFIDNLHDNNWNESLTYLDAPWLCTTDTTDLSWIFYEKRHLNLDLSTWDTSSVTNMEYMFYNAEAFNSDLSNWDVSSATNLSNMFYYSTSFNSDLSAWDTSSVTNMEYMFYYATNFNSDLSNWNVSNVTNLSNMFYYSTSFNSDLSAWDTSSVINMYGVFGGATSFNSDLSDWDTSSVTNMNSMFGGATSFNSDLSGWDTSSVIDMSGMFSYALSFNQDLSGWCVSNFSSSPSSFDSSTTAWILPKPVWGTCP